MPLYRYLEFVTYSLLNLLPYMLLALYPVRNNLRVSKSLVAFFLVFLCIVDCIRTYLIASGLPAGMLSVATLIIQIGFYFLSVKQPIGKSFFFLLCLTNLASFLGMIAKFTEGILFPSLAVQRDRWSFSLCLLVTELIFLIPLFFYIKKVYVPSMERDRIKNAWRILWIVPATFYLIWYVHVYMNGLPTLEVLLSSRLVVLQIAIVSGSFFTYHSIIRLVTEENKNRELQEKEYQYQLQISQYSGIKDRVTETKKSATT